MSALDRLLHCVRICVSINLAVKAAITCLKMESLKYSLVRDRLGRRLIYCIERPRDKKWMEEVNEEVMNKSRLGLHFATSISS